MRAIEEAMVVVVVVRCRELQAEEDKRESLRDCPAPPLFDDKIRIPGATTDGLDHAYVTRGSLSRCPNFAPRLRRPPSRFSCSSLSFRLRPSVELFRINPTISTFIFTRVTNTMLVLCYCPC